MSVLPLFASPLFKKNFTIDDVNLNEKSDVVFEENGFQKLRSHALECTGEYFYGLMNVRPDTGIYITKSVINRNETNRNSIITGVIMLSDGIITFNGPQRSLFQFQYLSENDFNSSTYIFKVKKGDFIVFPSHLDFKVEGDNIKWYTFIYNLVNKYLAVPPPPVFGKPPTEWEKLTKSEGSF